MSTYHMRREDRNISDQTEILKIIKNAKFSTIGMAKENEPYLVTLSHGYDEKNNVLYFHCANEGKKIDFIKNNSIVCATIIENNGYVDGKCEQHYSSLLIFGKMFIIENIEEKKNGLNVILHHLESEPESILKRNIPNDESYHKIIILKLKIERITGKKGK